jgi:hypothetical protein
MESAGASGRKVRLKVGETASVLALKRVMLTVPDPLVLKSARTHHVRMTYPAKNGSVVVKNL